MNKRLFLLPLMTVCAMHVHAQTQQVAGRVTDAKDGTPFLA